MRTLVDLTGQRFGEIQVMGRAVVDKKGTYWTCLCNCGVSRIVFGASLKRGATKSCGCSKSRNGEIFKKRPYESLYNLLKREANPNLTHTLTYEEFTEFTKINECHYCGEDIKWTAHNIHWNGARYNLDRKNNKVGYTKENCVVCCKRCNRAKSDSFSYEEWKMIGNLMKSNPEVFKVRK